MKKETKKEKKKTKKPEEIPAMENSAEPPSSDDSENIDPVKISEIASMNPVRLLHEPQHRETGQAQKQTRRSPAIYLPGLRKNFHRKKDQRQKISDPDDPRRSQLLQRRLLARGIG